jgi:hypothetical protein
MAYTKKAIQESKDSLTTNYLKPGDTVFMSLSRVSRSGMSRIIKCYTEELYNISFDVAHAVDCPFVDGMTGGVRISGCGMDMGLALADMLSYALFGKPVDQGDNSGGLKYKWI